MITAVHRRVQGRFNTEESGETRRVEWKVVSKVFPTRLVRRRVPSWMIAVQDGFRLRLFNHKARFFETQKGSSSKAKRKEI